MKGYMRGFSRLAAEERSAMASKAAKAVKPENRTYSRNPELAKTAGRKGGLASGVTRKAWKDKRDA